MKRIKNVHRGRIIFEKFLLLVKTEWFRRYFAVSVMAAALLFSVVYQSAFAGPGPHFKNPITETINYLKGGDIHKEVWADRVEVVRKMLVKHPKRVNLRNKQFETPLHIARSKEMAELLISKGADVNAKTRPTANYDRTPLHAAIENERTGVALAIIDAGCNMELKDIYENTPLVLACGKGRLEIVRRLVECGADISTELKSMDIFVNNPLAFAISKDDKELAAMILKKGGELTDGGMQLAIYKEKPDMLKCLIANGAKFDVDEALYKALQTSYANNEAVIEYLVSIGAGVNCQRVGFKNSPLHCAVWGHKPRAIEFLVKKGADVNSRNHDSLTPIGIALNIASSENTTPEGKAANKLIIKYFEKIGAKK